MKTTPIAFVRRFFVSSEALKQWFCVKKYLCSFYFHPSKRACNACSGKFYLRHFIKNVLCILYDVQETLLVMSLVHIE